MTRRETNRFKVKSDKGKIYTIIEYTNYKDTTVFSGNIIKTETPDLKSYFTDTGLLCEYIDAKSFKIIDTGEIVRKI